MQQIEDRHAKGHRPRLAILDDLLDELESREKLVVGLAKKRRTR